MKSVTFLFFFVSILQNSFSQYRNKIDRLNRALNTLHDSARIDCLNELSETYLGLPEWFSELRERPRLDSAEILISQALKSAKDIGYIYGAAKALSLKAKIAFEKYEDFLQTEVLCHEAVYNYKKSANKKGLYKTYYRLGTALHSLSRFDDAVNNLDTSYVLSKLAADSFYALSSAIVSCISFDERGDYAKAFERLQRDHELIAANGDPKWKLLELNKLGDLNADIGNYSTAINYYKHSFSDSQKNDLNATLAQTFALNKQFDSATKYFNLYIPDTIKQRDLRFYLAFSGEFYSSMNNYNKALPDLLRSLHYNRQSKDANQIMRLLIDIAGACFALQNIDAALSYAQEAFAMANQTGAKQVIRDASKIISSVYEYRNRPDSAYRYYKRYVTINDSIVNNKLKGQLASYDFEQRIELLNKQQELQQLQLQKQVLQKYFLLAGIAVFFLIAFMLWRNNLHRKKAYASLQTQKKQTDFQKLKVEEAFDELKSAQLQLVQREKMASLGELTAGIAHEIQNPLNFVNNFSDVNKELLEEMKDEMGKGNLEDANSLANDIIANEEKINHHGKRADAIVKGMLQHSRSSSGQKEPTDINALCDEYLRLSYHGLRAKDKSFNADFKTDFDESIGKINIIPQDIGRVLLNIINNAFYAVNEKQKAADKNYKPLVSIKTKRIGDTIEINVEDNGNGIPQNIINKIFQPFFTTKPTGQGTGLGLSLSYDIIKAHGGEIKMDSKENDGTIFTILLPALP
ncbi:ATP-binding protein [Ferruginibacter paludis]|uniref:ATP-binding protein n=1 Tax=Ferruginibacter paludis TaxID=1310417 RepID=UPI0025B542DC|nr:ATP-binding protein [Ferruginibacter paludis]MDN3657280.1 ATP-binding protein [Ferruginibacter paludis]